ncbi:MAG TPA: poly-beta-1,6-N-acetyl-D-glucosamine synthase [Candidatus Polarisedimenticolaceae bacterium]|nr:poly-beta-1,6-N-acetyl-D-glucosamine synthase [Candidatus Polarisedimenticolaceae bacterium]
MSWYALVVALFDFTFFYPLIMSILWVTGSVYYFFYRERASPAHPDAPPDLAQWPPVSFLVPCHNEGTHVVETIQSLLDQDYPVFEIIAVNDASTDETGERLDRLSREDYRVRVIHFRTNQGKAMGLRVASLAAKHEILVAVDGDALLTPRATKWLARHFVDGPRVGAVTGNPRVRNRSTLLGKIQVGEFSSIIGLLKRAQRIYGRVFTVSGVVAAFRKAAVHQVGYWGLEVMTEDIDVSWRLQLAHWDIRYEPNALCWILMPETLRGLWRQRLRWAQGGMEVLGGHFPSLFRWRARRMWLVAAELVASTFWAYAMAAVFATWVAGRFVDLPAPFAGATVFPGWSGLLLGTMCLLQFLVSVVIDSRYESRLGRVYYWLIWYPMVYWAIQVVTSVYALPRALLRPKWSRGTWTSPDRGLARRVYEQTRV